MIEFIAGMAVGVAVLMIAFIIRSRSATFNWKHSKYGVYQALNFIGHLTYKRRRTRAQYQRLADGKYLPQRAAEFLMRRKASDRWDD